MASQIWGEFPTPPPNPPKMGVGGGGEKRSISTPKSPIPLKVPPPSVSISLKNGGNFPPSDPKKWGGNDRFPFPNHQLWREGKGEGEGEGKKALKKMGGNARFPPPKSPIPLKVHQLWGGGGGKESLVNQHAYSTVAHTHDARFSQKSDEPITRVSSFECPPNCVRKSLLGPRL